MQAIIGTFVAFGVMLALYSSGRLRATPRFQKMMTVALVSYLGIAAGQPHRGDLRRRWRLGLLRRRRARAWCCALIGVALAAFTLVLDFDAIEKGVEAGLPERESWRAAFGLMVTLVWLYLELLRLLAILNSRN